MTRCQRRRACGAHTPTRPPARDAVLTNQCKEGGQVDSGQKRDWRWLPAHMPGVAKLMRERRAQLGDAWVSECWRRGVLQGEPGWFYAAEGALAVGTPWRDEADIAELLLGRITPTQALLVMRPTGVGDGAN